MATRVRSKSPRVAIVHDWLTNLGGAERVVLAISQAFPQAPIFTSVYNTDKLPEFTQKNIQTSYLQHWPLAKSHHQLYPLARMRAFESFDFKDYDIVISSSSAEAKSIITDSITLHVAYIHTPIRYYWSGYRDYLKSPGLGFLSPLARIILPLKIKKLRSFDFATAQRPDLILTNSKTVQNRTREYYKRDSTVIYPPVDIDRFDLKQAKEGDYYLVVSRLIPYKKVEIAVRAMSELGKRLIVVGTGSQKEKLEKKAGPSIEFQGALSDDDITKLYLGSKALIFTADEDFGITPLESMAAGKPVICYGHGGATESIIDGVTGIYFDKQTSSSLKKAIKKFETMSFDVKKIRHRAEEFSTDKFIKQLTKVIDQYYKKMH